MASQTTGKPEPIRSSQKLGSRLRNSLVAAATRLKTETVRRTGRNMRQDWQQDAWDLFDLVGEQHFLATTLANRLGQARLYVGKLTDDPTEPPEPIEDGPAAEVFAGFGGSQGTRAQLISRLGLNLFVAGDGWLVGIPRHILPGTDDAATEPDPDSEFTPVEILALSDLEWRMLSVSEVAFDNTRVTLKFGESTEDQTTVWAEDIFLIRVWRPHPRRWWEADSPTRASLPVLRELVGLTEHVSAQVDSRLAGAGVFVVPQSATDALLSRSGAPEDDESDQDPFTENLMDAMLTPIKDRSNASAFVPLVLSVPDEAAEKFRHISFASQLDAEARELRDEAIRRLALGQDAPPELLLGCVDSETEILTRDGWRTQDQISEGTEVLTLNHDTGLSEWQLIEKMNRFEVTDRRMLRMKSDQHDSFTTMEHRWPVIKKHRNLAGSARRWTSSGEGFTRSDRVPIAAPLAEPTGLVEAKYRDDFVRLVVAYTSDGTRIRNDGIRIVKFDDAEIVEMRRILATVVGPTGYREEHHPTATVDGRAFVLRQPQARELLDLCGEHKEIPRSFVDELTHTQRLLFLDSAVQIGDGVLSGERATTLYQVQPERLEAFEYAAILTGHKVTIGVRSNNTGFGTRPLSWVRWSLARTEFAPVHVEQSEETYTGLVWCPTTPNQTWLARRGGTVWYTGNSGDVNHWGAWLVREDTVTTHVEPPLALMCDALTTQFLRPVLIQQGMSPDEAAEYVIWYDVSHLIQRPNRVQDAQQAHAAGVISDEAYRDVLGFSEVDAPQVTGVDPAVATALELVQAAPSLMQQPGLPALVEQIRQVMSGETVESVESVPVDDQDQPVDDGEGAPDPPSDTINDVTLPEDTDTPPPADIAASGLQPVFTSQQLATLARIRS